MRRNASVPTHVAGVFLKIALFGSVCASAQEARSSFTASLSAPQTTVSSGTDILIDMTLKNERNEELLIRSPRNGPETAGLIVENSDGDAAKCKESVGRRGSSIGTFIRAGQSKTERINLSYWFDLTKPGEYFVQMRRKDIATGAVVESNKLAIAVVSSTE